MISRKRVTISCNRKPIIDSFNVEHKGGIEIAFLVLNQITDTYIIATFKRKSRVEKSQ